MLVCRAFAGQNSNGILRRVFRSASLVESTEAPKDAILLQGLQFFGYHGVLPEEQTLGQKFCVDAKLRCCLKAPGCSDDLKDTISYADIHRDIKAIMEGPPHQLLESVAETISSMLLDSYPKIQAVELRLTKPHVAVPGAFDSLGIEIHRTR
ncbi:hypothetical protein WJX84_007898 [Apatococcus fuscideae]|uniref:7,8-dihydroneopterin aldolase n=1 Tax=Apatococcus fuscideae TaxID=2026836 RepID=A0AAW1SZF8_9CHLO